MNQHVAALAPRRADAATVSQWLDEPGEIAFIDVREEGQFGLGHPLLAVSIPYSILETVIEARVPRKGTRIVVADAGDGVADKARQRLEALGYTDVFTLQGGVAAWADIGKPLFEGINVPSKAFAEVVEHSYHTPHIEPEEVKKLLDAKADVVVIDNRTAPEFERFHVPGAANASGFELVQRIADLAPSPDTLVVISCAGRTRSIIGTQSLISAGIPNRVVALKGGTQGWRLAGLELEGGGLARREPSAEARAAAVARTRKLADDTGVKIIDSATLRAWRADAERTFYLFDVRSPDEYRLGHVEGAVSAPGGQLVQTLDLFAAARGARIVLSDEDGVRAIVTAYWLRQIGWDVAVLNPDAEPRASTAGPPRPDIKAAGVSIVDGALAASWKGAVISVGSSAAFREGHPPGAVWSIRPRIAETFAALGKPARVLVIGEDDDIAVLAAGELAGSGAEIAVLKGGLKAWKDAGLPLEASPGVPPDSERIDFLFWNHDRHNGNPTHSRGYLNWELQLPEQIAQDGGAGFRISAAS